ncbi:THO complex subunit 2 [Aplysia californica]|uniref:THO complex subunit 2 n=1 Tax=Aplysia californica TaxID=6500 RepID=A0ABM0ZYM2_APLCA|nr:THO complex subunit 2 [Aplysia californica]
MATVCLSQEILRNWDKTGRSEFVKLCKGLTDSDSSVKLLQKKNLKRALYEVCSAVTRSQLKLENAVNVLADLKDYLPSVPSSLADILGILDVESSCSDDTSREKFLSLVNALRQVVVPDGLLKERLDQDSLELAGLVASQQGFNQKYVKTKTRLYYKQQKFNLLREESEGYSKLITELNQDITGKLTWEQVLQNIKSLIGCFDLDPNRVLDIILEAFECHPEEYKFYIPLLRAYIIDKLTLCHILGFKFHFRESTDWSTPKSLFKCAALLLNHQLVDLDDLYPYLQPLDSEIIPFHNKEVADAKAYAKKLNTVILSDKKEEDKDKDEQQIIDLRENNQKLGLCEALLEIGAWDNAKAILDRLPEHFAVVHKSISQALCALVHRVIEPLYDRNTGLTATLAKKRDKREQGQCECSRAHSFKEVFHSALPMLSYLGPHAASDPILMVKIIRLAKTFMNKRHSGGIGPEDDVAYYGFLNVLEEVLLPSLALLPGNCAMGEELWNLLKLYPYEIRYRLYGTWKNESYFQHPILIRARADCLERAKYIMKRLSKETVKPSGRQLGKLSHNNPGIVFEYVLNQIQRYDNLIGPVVDALKYLTSMSYDMLTFCIIEAIANPEKDRMKTDNMNISMWLQSLASFAGAICRKYQVELTGILQYVANQLKAGKSTDLLLLREVVQKMAGIEISEEITDDQLDAMAGGELVRQEGSNFSQVRNTKKSSTRLKDTLLEHDLALSLCLLMAQQRDSTVFAEDANKHLKLVGKLYDQCQDTLVQFGSFLSMQLSTEEFVKRLPAVDVLLSTFHIPHSAAFFLSRPLYAHAINVKYDELKKSEKAEKAKSKTKSDSKIQFYIDASEEVMHPIVEAIQPVFSSKIWDDLTPQFYITFWSLSMYDLYVPTAAYQKQIQLQQSQIKAIDDNRDMPSNKKKKEVDRCNILIDKLEDEMKKQAEHVARVKARLEEEKELWFPTGTLKSEMTTNLLQYCLFPRCCFTASDAVYCGHFIKVLHELKTPNFSTLITYDRVFNDITYTVTSCTENEAHRYGRFLCSALETIMRWHSSPAIYEEECYNFPGFLTVFRKGTDLTNKMDRLDYENYRHVCHKWHFRLTKSVITCLESKNYSQIRNSLIVLTKILPHFPRMTQIGMAIERRVDKLSKEEKDKRPDIYALAIGYSGQLKSKKVVWVQETDFHIKEPKKPASSAAQQQAQQQKQAESASSGASGKKGDGDGRAKDIKQESGGKEDKKDRGQSGDVERKEKKERGAEKKESKEKKDAKRSSGVNESNGVSAKKEVLNSPDGQHASSRQTAMEMEEDGARHPHQHREQKPVKEEKPKKSERKDREASKLAKEKAREEKRERKEREAAAAMKEEERHVMGRPLDHERDDRGGSGGHMSSSSGSSHRRSAEVSPRHVDDRESKRRRLEAGATSQDSSLEVRTKHRKSASPDDEGWEMEKEKERKEKKRDHSMEEHDAEFTKRRKSEEHYSASRKLNGEPNGSLLKGHGEREYKEKSSKQSHSSRKEQFIDGEDSPKIKTKEKREKSSSKKQKK